MGNSIWPIWVSGLGVYIFSITINVFIFLEILVSAGQDEVVEKMFRMTSDVLKLPCDLTSKTNELPVMWFKDDLLVSTITSGKYSMVCEICLSFREQSQ